MTTGRWVARTLLILLALGLSAPPAVSLPLPQEPAGDPRADAPATEAPDEEVTDAERVIRIEGVIELDRQKLAELREDVSERQNFFDSLADGIKAIEVDLSEKKSRLEEVGDTGDPAERSSFEAEISTLETELDLLKTQAELAFASLSATREQIGALDKKIEREQRTLDILQGVAPEEQAVPAVVPVPVAAQPGAATSPVSVIPGLPAATPTATSIAPAALIESTAQVEALRELERKQREAAEARQFLVEFVKRKNSLEQQIAIEGELLDTAKESVANLTRALESRREDLEQATASGESDDEVRRLRTRASRIESLIDGARKEIDERAAYLEALSRRFDKLHNEELSIKEKVTAMRDAVSKAQARLRWLQSPFHPENLLRWARERGPRVVAVLVAVVLLLALLRLGIGRMVRLLVRRSHDTGSVSDRADTLALSFRSAATFLLLVLGAFLVLEEAGVDVKTVLGGAAILGVAVAFGAQNLMRDYFTGFLILLENQFELGDVVTIGSITGTVESVNMRVTMLRDLEGKVHFIPNGEIKSVTNRTYQWGRAVLEIPVSYDENVDHVMEVLLEIAKGLRADPDYAERVTEDPVMLGIDDFTEHGVIVKFMVKTLPDQMVSVRRELLRRVKNRFDELGIRISVHRRIVLQKSTE